MVTPEMLKLLPRWRNPAEIAFMGTRQTSGHHGFALGK